MIRGNTRGALGIVRALLSRVFWASIWAPGSIPLLERKYAVPLKRFVLPAYDILLVIGGYVAIHNGIPALDRLLPHGVATGIAITLMVTAIGALFGIAFPKLWRLETAAKVGIVGLLGLYFVAIVSVGGDTRAFIAIIVLLTLPTPCARLWLLGIERRDREEERERRE
jgi:hypothetical protein